MSEGLFGPETDESLSGTVTREIFRNAQGTFAVVRLTTEGGFGTTLTGPLPPVQPGERLEAKGEWVDDPRHGKQFKAHTCYHRPPDSVEAIERYLGSGSIEGVGPELAKRLVDHFGTETLVALGEGAERLSEVKGIGAVKAERIAKSWAAQHASRDVMLFLRGHGIGPVLAQRVFTRFGAEARGILENDPFVLAREVDGAGFLTADRLALALGFARDDARRLRAGLLHVAEQALSQGSTAIPVDALLEQAAEALGAAPQQLEPALDAARDDLALELDRPLDEEVVYLPRLLRQAHPFWEDESLDGFAELVAWRTDERSLRVFGLAQLITEDQSWTPCELLLTIAPEQARFAALTCRLGSPGTDRGGLDRSYTHDRLDEALRAFAVWRTREADWVYEVRLPRPAEPSGPR